MKIYQVVPLFCLLPFSTLPAQVEWIDPGTDTWFDGANWSLGMVPGPGDATDIDNGGTAQIDGGSAGSTFLRLGTTAGDSGTIQITNGGTLAIAGLTGQAEVGYAGTGTVAVSGGGSLFSTSNLLRVGTTGSGEVTVFSGATLSSGSAILGYFAAGEGTVRIGSSSWTNGLTVVGLEGTGNLEITSGSTVTLSTLRIADLAGSDGVVAVFGAGTILTTPSAITVGNAGTGVLSISASSTVIAPQVAEGAGGNGSVIFTSLGTLRLTGNQPNLFAGFEDGDIEIFNVGVIDTQSFDASTSVGLQAGPAAGLRKDGSGTLTLTGSNNLGGGILVAEGEVTIDGGSLGSAGNRSGALRAGASAGQNAAINLVNASVFLTTGIEIGNSGTGALNLSAGTLLDSEGAFFIGVNSGSVGTVTIAGAGTQVLLDSVLFVGAEGEGTLSVTGGGQLLGSTGSAIVGNTGQGTVRIDGIGSEATLMDGWDIGAFSGATGLAEVTSGGKFGSGSSPIRLGRFAGATGQIDIGTGGAPGIVDAASITTGDGTGSVRFNHNAANYFFTTTGTSAGAAVPISGPTSVDLIGTGRTNLTGTHTYSGNTTVSAGDLRILGTLSNSAVSVASGATLSGTGTIAQQVTIANGGHIAPGASPGTLNTGTLVLNNSSLLDFELDTPNVVGGGVNDLIDVTGNLTLDGILNINDLGNFGDGTYRLFNYSGLLTNNTLAFGSVPSLFDYTLDISTPNQVNLTVAALASQFWDGANTTANGIVNGGTGTWDEETTNWTNTAGNANSAWEGDIVATFSGSAGTVTIANGFTANPTGVSFQTTGYTIAAAGTGNLGITGSTPFVTGSGISATISAPITGSGLLFKDGAGSLVLSGVNTYSGGTTVRRGALVVSGSITHGTSALTVGDGGGSATFLLGSGATAVTGSGVINNLGEAIVETGSSWDSGATLGVGGTLTVRTGGTVEAENVAINAGGLARVSGAGSELTVGSELAVGVNSTGTLIVEDNAAVDADAVIAADSGTGDAEVRTGGSLTGTALTVGENGQGSLLVSTGGTVTYTAMQLGENAGGEGTLTIDGAGSSVNATGFFAGASGTGTLNLQSGGTLNTTSVTLADLAGSSGTLNVGNGGAAGILNGGGVGGGAGTALVNFNHTDENYFFTGNGAAGGSFIVIFGNTTVRQSGPGTTTLVGANTYTGGTEINGGVLRISDNASLGAAAGTLSFNGGTLSTTATLSMDRATTLLVGGGTFDTEASTTLTHSGVIGGAGSLAKTGRGTLTLTGHNTYSGGTFIAQGTLRIGDGGTQGSVVGDIQNQGVLVFDRSDSVTFRGVISGNGSLIKEGEGALTLTGDHTYAGGTSITAGTLRIGNGGTTGSIIGDVENEGELIFHRSNDLVFAGNIRGAGSLTKQGAGVLTLTGNATHSGGTTIRGGALQIGAGGIRGSIEGDIRNDGVLAFNRSDVVTYAGTVSGKGDLLQLGSGALILTGDNRHTGATEVRNGALFVNGSLDNSDVTVFSGALLGGSGRIRGDVVVENGAVLSPGNSPGILNLGSLSLSRRATTLFEIRGTRAGSEHDQLLVDRTASLGGTLRLEFGRRFTPEEGDKIFLIKAGNLKGRFDAIASNVGDIFDLDLVYNRSSLSLRLDVDMRSFTDFAGNENQQAVATNLDEVAADGEMPRLISRLNTLSGPEISEALQEISPDALGAMTDVAKRYNRAQGRNLLGRLQEWRDTDGAVAGHASTSGLHFTGKDAQPVSPKGPDYAPMASTWSLFASGTGQLANVASDGNGVGYDFTTAGMTLGADKNLGFFLGGNLVGGAYVGYAGSDVDIDGNGGTIDANAAKFGLFGGWYGDNLYLSSQMGGGVTQYDTRRDVLNQQQNGDTTGYEFTSETAVGYTWETGTFRFTPEAALAYNYVSVDSFTESGGLAPLKIDEQSLESLQSRIGFRTSYGLQFSDGHWLRPALHASWGHEFLELANSIEARFASGAGGIFSVTPTRQGRDTAIAGASLSFGHESNWNTWFGYEAEGANGILVHTLNAGASIRF